MKNHATVYYLHAVFLALSCLIGIPFFLMYQDVVARSVQSFLSLRTNPDLLGGKIATVLYDPVGDDSGFGSIVYPSFSDGQGSLDIVRYTVYQPVQGSKGPGLRDYWQLGFTFRAASTQRNIRVYLGTQDGQGGSVHTKTEFAEGIEFSSRFPWQYLISIIGEKGTIESFDGTFKQDVPVYSLVAGTELVLRIPLTDEELSFLYDFPDMYQYVLVGLNDIQGNGGFSGNGVSDFAPNLYDIVVPEGFLQSELLSGWSEEDFTLATLEPVSIRLSKSVEEDSQGVESTDEAIAAYQTLKKNAASEREEKQQQSRQRYASPSLEPFEAAVAAFNAGMYDDAEKLFDTLLSTDRRSSPAMAYKGSLVALRADKAPPLEAVGIVKEAYEWLDRSVKGAQGDLELYTALMNRASVSLAVPDAIFGYAQQGGDDFIRASECVARLLKSKDASVGVTREDYIGAVCNAALCYEISADAVKAETWFRETKRMLQDTDETLCAFERMETFRYFELGEEKVKEKKSRRKEDKDTTKADDKRNAQATELASVLSLLDSNPGDLQLVEKALRLQIMELDAITDGLALANANKGILVDSLYGQLFIAVAECKMATKVKKVVDKVDWITQGMRRFETIQRRWPNNETVYIYQVLTYSYFPSDLNMYEQVLDLLDQMKSNYVHEAWTLSEDQADLLLLVIKNLKENYPSKTERAIIHAAVRSVYESLPVLAARPMAQEVFGE